MNDLKERSTCGIPSNNDLLLADDIDSTTLAHMNLQQQQKEPTRIQAFFLSPPLMSDESVKKMKDNTSCSSVDDGCIPPPVLRRCNLT